MEIKDKFAAVHEDFFGNVVGTIVSTIKSLATTPANTEFVADWTMPH